MYPRRTSTRWLAILLRAILFHVKYLLETPLDFRVSKRETRFRARFIKSSLNRFPFLRGRMRREKTHHETIKRTATGGTKHGSRVRQRGRTRRRAQKTRAHDLLTICVYKMSQQLLLLLLFVSRSRTQSPCERMNLWPFFCPLFRFFLPSFCPQSFPRFCPKKR